jgi:hypothetical protein
VEGRDYQETYAAVARADSYKLITTVVVICNWIIENIDIKTAFLNGIFDCDVYIELPDGRIGKLLKSLYGLKQAPKIWYDTLNAVLTGMGFITLPIDAYVYMQSSSHQSNGTIYVHLISFCQYMWTIYTLLAEIKRQSTWPRLGLGIKTSWLLCFSNAWFRAIQGLWCLCTGLLCCICRLSYSLVYEMKLQHCNH